MCFYVLRHKRTALIEVVVIITSVIGTQYVNSGLCFFVGVDSVSLPFGCFLGFGDWLQ